VVLTLEKNFTERGFDKNTEEHREIASIFLGLQNASNSWKEGRFCDVYIYIEEKKWMHERVCGVKKKKGVWNESYSVKWSKIQRTRIKAHQINITIPMRRTVFVYFTSSLLTRIYFDQIHTHQTEIFVMYIFSLSLFITLKLYILKSQNNNIFFFVLIILN